MNNTTNIINNICGDAYTFKVNENKKIVNFSKEDKEQIVQLVVNGYNC